MVQVKTGRKKQNCGLEQNGTERKKAELDDDRLEQNRPAWNRTETDGTEQTRREQNRSRWNRLDQARTEWNGKASPG